MKKSSELEELLAAGVISPETAARIRAYWQGQTDAQPNRLTVIFSVLGALLVGLGIILVVAHNWDQLGRITKTVLVFIPVLLGQAAGWYTLTRRSDSRAWREGSGVFLTLAVGACLAMISQIYHIEGILSDFLLGWLWLAFPIIYVLRSSLVSLLFWVGITWYGMEVGYDYPKVVPVWYWLLALGALPYYLYLRRDKPSSNDLTFHDWVIPGSLLLTFGTLINESDNWILLNYQVLLLLFYVVGKWWLGARARRNNGWLLIGLIGSVGILVVQSFRDFWRSGFTHLEIDSPALLAFVVLTGAILLLLFFKWRGGEREIFSNPLSYLSVILLPFYLIGWESPLVGAIISNLILLGVGLYHILLGARRDDLVIVNFGLMIITAQIVSRFFDTDITFALRGLLFLLLGVGFFATNMYLLKRRKAANFPDQNPEL